MKSFCRSCNAEIVWARTEKDKRIPVNLDSLTTKDKHDAESGATIRFDYRVHQSHFATCPDANRWRR